jgi:hypothetical protein
LAQREQLDVESVGEDGVIKIYEPQRHEGTGVDEEELGYESALMSVDEAIEVLGGSMSADVVKRAWEAVCLRRSMEAKGVDVVAK